MRATGLNHVSIHATSLEASTRFYVEVFGMETVPTYTFAFPVQFLRLGNLQLHVFERDTEAPELHHFALNVDDFEETFRRARDLGILEQNTFFQDLNELPDGSVQMYLRDPAGNLVEVDWPDASTLDRSRLPELKKLTDTVEQAPGSEGATLYLDGASAGP